MQAVCKRAETVIKGHTKKIAEIAEIAREINVQFSKLFDHISIHVW